MHYAKIEDGYCIFADDNKPIAYVKSWEALEGVYRLYGKTYQYAVKSKTRTSCGAQRGTAWCTLESEHQGEHRAPHCGLTWGVK